MKGDPGNLQFYVYFIKLNIDLIDFAMAERIIHVLIEFPKGEISPLNPL